MKRYVLLSLLTPFVLSCQTCPPQSSSVASSEDFVPPERARYGLVLQNHGDYPVAFYTYLIDLLPNNKIQFGWETALPEQNQGSVTRTYRFEKNYHEGDRDAIVITDAESLETAGPYVYLGSPFYITEKTISYQNGLILRWYRIE